MKPANPRFGLVLAGGGAKGAYQAGALRYLTELGLVPQIIAGTSIGALNGAILISHQSFPQAVSRLNQAWHQLGQVPILRPYTGTALFDSTPIEQFLRAFVNPVELRRGIELWVTVFPSLKIPGLDYKWWLNLVRAQSGYDALWFCAQDFADDESLYNLLLASAALPLIFPEREVNGQFYVDGGLGDNVPLKALASRGCTHAIVIHLDSEAAWSRHDFPEQTIIEIRPERSTNKFDTPLLGTVSSMLDFSAGHIASLQQRGYDDARRCLESIIKTFTAVKHQRQSHESLVNSTQRLLNDLPL